MGVTRQWRTCCPWAQVLLFLALFIDHFSPVDDAYAMHRKLMSETGKGSDLAKQTFEFRVPDEDLSEVKTSKEQTGRTRRSGREGQHHPTEEEKWERRQAETTDESMTQATTVEGSQDDTPRTGTELTTVSQRDLWVTRKKTTRTSTTLLPRVAEGCPHCREEDTLYHAEDNDLEYWCSEANSTSPQNHERRVELEGCILTTKSPVILFEFSCTSPQIDDTGRTPLNVFLLPKTKRNGKAAEVGKKTNPKRIISTFHNTSFLANYDIEFAKSCHDFVDKLKILSEARVDHGYVEQYYEHPGLLSANDKQCMRMARKNGALYHENKYLHMLSFNKSKTLPTISVIIYKSPPNVPFHELAFLLLRDKKYRCIKKLFRLVKSVVVGDVGSLYLTYKPSEHVEHVCTEDRETPNYWIWLKVITTNPMRISFVSECTTWLNSDLIALLIQGPLRIASSTVHDLHKRLLEQFLLQDQPVFVFEMPQDVLMGYSFVTENKNTLNCTFHSRVTICRGDSARSPYTFMFMHDCNPHFFNETGFLKTTPAFYSLILGTEMDLNLCSSDTSFIYIPFKIKLMFERCEGLDFYLLNHGDIQSMAGSQVIHPFTYLRVYYLDSFLKCNQDRVFNVVERKNPYLFFNEYGNTLRTILAQLEKHFGVDELTLLTEGQYKWSVHALLQTTLETIQLGLTECLDEKMIGRTIIYEDDTNRYITSVVKSNKLNYCVYFGQKSIYLSLYSLLEENKVTVNLFWPSCGNMNSMVIRNETVTSEWHYLSTGCRVIQVFFLIITASITVVTIGGNMFVLYIIQKFRMWEIRRYGPAFFILRSLAIADLLSGLFPGTLAVWDQVMLMTGHLTLRTLDKDQSFRKLYFTDLISHKLQAIASLGDVRLEREGYPMFCAFVLSVSSIVSLLMLFLLSVERYKGVKNVSFPCFQVVGSVVMSWIIAFVLGILLFIREDGFHSAGYFDPISKLTVSTAQSGRSPSIIVFGLQVLLAGGVGGLMIFITFYTFYIHIGYRKDRERHTKVTVHPSQDRTNEDLKFFMFFLTLVLLYLASCLPIAIHTVFGLSEIVPLMQFIAWWLFMAGGSWNWYIYTYRRGPFQRNLKTWKMRRERKKKIHREFRRSIEMR